MKSFYYNNSKEHFKYSMKEPLSVVLAILVNYKCKITIFTLFLTK
jgi:phage gp36-like protein